MTNNNLRAYLISEIEGLERFFRDLSPGLREEHGLSDSPLNVQFGPDVETVFTYADGSNMFRGSVNFAPDTLVAGIHRELSSKEMILGTTVVDEDDFIEIRLRPSRALRLCEDYEGAQDILTHAADKIGAEAHCISAHWHMSVSQGGRDKLSIGAASSFRPNHLANSIRDNMVDMQTRFPAFFIRPFRAEQYPLNQKRYAGPRTIEFDNTKGNGTVNFANISRPIRTIEPRISPDDPYQAAYLYLKSLENALVSDPVSLEEETPSVRRGAGGYLHMLEQTAQGLKDDPGAFPSHVSDGMMRASIEGYDRYLDENTKAKPDEISDLKQRMWALKQEFSVPEVQRPNAELAVT